MKNIKPDYSIIILSVALVLFGIVMVFNSSVVVAQRDFQDKYYFLKNQLLWSLLGIVFFLITSKVDYRFWSRITVPALIGSFILLLAVFIPGLGVKAYGAHRWLDFGFFSVQPAEVMKMSLVLYLSTIFTKKIKLAVFLVVLSVILGVVLLQRDLGTATVIGLIGLILYYLSGAPLKQFLVILPFSLLALLFFIFSSAYRRARFMTFLDPAVDPQGISYHINQILIALGSGGFLGLGLGQSRQKYGFLPEVTTDSIFAVVGEELGFVGATALVVLYLLLVIKTLLTAQKAPDKFGFLVASGIGCWIGVQAFINLSSMTALTPLTGVPLPFMSYGGSSLVVTMAAMGIVFNISKQSISNNQKR